MKKKLQNVVKGISVAFAIIGIIILVIDIAFALGFFGIILGIAFIVAGILAYKSGIAYLDETFNDNK